MNRRFCCCIYLVETDVILCSCLGKSLERFFIRSRFHCFDKSWCLVGATSDGFSSAFTVQSSHWSFVSQRKLSLVAEVCQLKCKLNKCIFFFKLKLWNNAVFTWWDATWFDKTLAKSTRSTVVFSKRQDVHVDVIRDSFSLSFLLLNDLVAVLVDFPR